ncbi:unnamed protein product [Kuraishia capsulata CBS 1993]|uniref:Cell wall mannoprotein PIR1-like C-terminal domain-containing protein n=1 Tax=Kuraishia capsulata CBS 1993 TaxID=1382522 RepID=W6MVA5_9ASCO|nr:uncharacterized protein KUCA_T00005846001 [Kuraishia capsulata CBS 1993]CDK29852.1 unnamed protein product [Kuraishia capsulata CBS 1993]
MQYRLSSAALLGAFAVNSVAAAYIPTEPWSTLTPSATLVGGTTDWTSTFGIAVQSVTSLAKREVTQIGDGQVQAATTTKSAKKTAAVVTQISDGQVQATTKTKSAKKSTKTTAAVVTQISDGQVQATTKTTSAKKTSKTSAAVVTQIGDGQIQADTTTKSAKKSSTKTAAAVVTQIGDGQIQADTTTKTAAVVTQIGDGQVQADTTTKTAAVATQIGDGQVQASTATSTDAAVTQIGDGQIQASTTTTGTAAAEATDGQTTSDDSESTVSVACKSDDALSLVLNGGILTDAKGRIGSIVANRQFQFDGPPPQAGAIYAAGWSVSEDGYLAIGNNTVFYQCLSGTFYNLYDESIGDQCHEVELQVVDLVSC